MSKFIDLSGRVFGDWTVVGLLRTSPTKWNCRCICGAVKAVYSSNLLRGGSAGCNCRKYKTLSVEMTQHGHWKNNRPSPTYVTWRSMLARCGNPKERAFKYYGGCGVSVCGRWKSFENFLADMGSRPQGRTLDRWPNNAGNYEPGNCRWATMKQQRHNRRIKPLIGNDIPAAEPALL